MRRWLSTGWYTLLATSSMAQATFHITLDSVQTLGGGNARSVREVDGGFLLFCHQISPDSSGETHLLIHKIDPAGNYLWAKDYGAGAAYGFGFTDPVSEIINDSIYAGTHRFGFEYVDLFFTVFNLEGDSIRSKVLVYDDSLHRVLRNIVPVDPTGFMLCGGFQIPDSLIEGYVIRTNHLGDTLWTRRYPGIKEILSLDNYVDGGFLLGSHRYLPANNCIVRIDSLGNVIWTRWLGGDDPDLVIGVMAGSDGSAIACTNYRDPAYPTDFADQMVVKYDANGTLIWQKRFIPFYFSNAFDLVELTDGSIVVAGFHAPRASITKLSSSGDSLWSRAYRYYDDNGSWETPYDIQATSDGGFVLAGEIVQDFGDPNPGLHTIFALKVDSMGCLVPGCDEVGVQEIVTNLRDALQIAPNPASGWAHLSWQLPSELQGKSCRLSVVGSQGGLVEERRINLSRNSYELDVSGYAPGVYHLHLVQDGTWISGAKLVVE